MNSAIDKKKHILIELWIYILTFISGYINSISIYKFLCPVSHVTGTVTKIGIDLSGSDYFGAMRSVGLLVLFFLGSMVSGILFHTKRFSLKKRYGILFMIYALFIFIFSFIPNIESIIIYIFSFVLGSQNAMFIFYKNSLIRTSHFTGYLTDAGFSFGKFLRGSKEELEKTVLYLFSMLIFIFGAFFGIHSIKNINAEEINVTYIQTISFLYFIVGIYYFIMRKYIDKTKL